MKQSNTKTTSSCSTLLLSWKNQIIIRRVWQVITQYIITWCSALPVYMFFLIFLSFVNQLFFVFSVWSSSLDFFQYKCASIVFILAACHSKLQKNARRKRWFRPKTGSLKACVCSAELTNQRRPFWRGGGGVHHRARVGGVATHMDRLTLPHPTVIMRPRPVW